MHSNKHPKQHEETTELPAVFLDKPTQAHYSELHFSSISTEKGRRGIHFSLEGSEPMLHYMKFSGLGLVLLALGTFSLTPARASVSADAAVETTEEHMVIHSPTLDEPSLPLLTETLTDISNTETWIKLWHGPMALESPFDCCHSQAGASDEGVTEQGSGSSEYNVPIVGNPKVQGHLRFFHTSIRDRFEVWLSRLGQYKPIVENIFVEFDLPSDLIYLSLVESGFNPHAYSRARATGPWQFMKGTALNYGLRVDRYVDERRDPIKSTVAAARYLRDLYDLFGTWPLAMAAYNAGEGKVLRALQAAGAGSFWEIARTKYIRQETKDYVPRYMAATIIAKNPDRFGLSTRESLPHVFDEVVITRPIHLKSLATTANLSYADLHQLNPELSRDMTPPGDSLYLLKVPVGTKGKVESSLASVPTWHEPTTVIKAINRKPFAKTVTLARSVSAHTYAVKSGDTVSSIAKRFKLSVQELKKKNNLSNRSLRTGDRLTIH